MESLDRQRTILITGATGLVGSHLLRYLHQAGFTRLRALRRPDSELSLLGRLDDQIDWRVGDVLDADVLEAAMEGVDVVFHCAGLVSFQPRDHEALFRTNVQGTANMVNAALYQQVDQFIHVSSIAALGRSRNGQTIDETTRWERSPFNTRYGISKFQAEQEVWRGHAEGLSVAILNPAIILGGGDWSKGPARFFPLIADGFTFYPSGNSGFVDVRDVVQLLVLLMQKNINGRRFIANAGHYSYREFFQHIAHYLNTSPPSVPVRSWMAEIAWRWSALQSFFTGQPPFLTRETARQSQRTFYYDNTRSLEELDFTYRDLEATIRETAQLYLDCTQEHLTYGMQPLPF